MRGCLGWLMLMPLLFAFWLAMQVANACAKWGGLWRLLGILASLVIGGICVGVGYLFAYEGSTEQRGGELYQVTWPILGWVVIIGGGLIAVLGAWTALVATKEDIERREKIEKLEKEMKKLRQKDEG